MNSRLDDTKRLYDLLGRLESKLGEKRTLADADALKGLPERGVYFFYEPGEVRSTSGSGLRIARVGTHALITDGNHSLRHRLATHRGAIASGGGNHRGSVFRKITGEALMHRDQLSGPTVKKWGVGSSASTEVRAAELPHEQAISSYIRQMPFLWLPVLDLPGPKSQRGVIEAQSIALLSNYLQPTSEWIDPPSSAWLGLHHPNQRICRSGLWNSRHVDQDYNPDFLELFESLVNSC